MDELQENIKFWNEFQTQGFSGNIVDVLDMLNYFCNKNWININSGKFSGCRYYETEHGLVVQHPGQRGMLEFVEDLQ